MSSHQQQQHAIQANPPRVYAALYDGQSLKHIKMHQCGDFDTFGYVVEHIKRTCWPGIQPHYVGVKSCSGGLGGQIFQVANNELSLGECWKEEQDVLLFRPPDVVICKDESDSDCEVVCVRPPEKKKAATNRACKPGAKRAHKPGPKKWRKKDTMMACTGNLKKPPDSGLKVAVKEEEAGSRPLEKSSAKIKTRLEKAACKFGKQISRENLPPCLDNGSYQDDPAMGRSVYFVKGTQTLTSIAKSVGHSAECLWYHNRQADLPGSEKLSHKSMFQKGTALVMPLAHATQMIPTKEDSDSEGL